MQRQNSKKTFYLFLYLIIGVIIIYTIQDFQTSRNVSGITGSRGGVHYALFAVLILLGIYYYFSLIRRGISSDPIHIVLWLITIWVALVNFAQIRNMWSAAVHMGLSCLWILIYDFFSSYLRRFPEAWPKIQFCSAILFCFYVFAALYAAHTIQMNFERIPVLNLAYNVLVFLPWILLGKTRWMRLLGISLVILVVSISMKRGAIIVFPLMLCTSILLETFVLKKPLGRPALKIIFVLLACSGSLFVADQLTHGFLSQRFSADQLADGSGRAHAYKAALHEVSQRSLWDLVLGRGSGSSIEYFGTGVHNEWLEFLFSFGLVGVMLYALLFLALGRQIKRLIRISSPYAHAYATAVVYMLVVGMYGGIYFVHSTLYIMALFGAIAGLMHSDATQQKPRCC